MGDFDDKHPRDERGRFSGSGLGAWANKKLGVPMSGEIGIREAKPREFKKAFATAFAGSDLSNHVTHYTKQQLRGMKLFMSADGKAGVAVHDHGDGRVEATALFNSGGKKGSGLTLLAHVIEHAGVNYVECYGPRLNKLYESLGFKVTDKFPFDPTQAAKTWDYEKHDHPDYHCMRFGNAA